MFEEWNNDTVNSIQDKRLVDKDKKDLLLIWSCLGVKSLQILQIIVIFAWRNFDLIESSLVLIAENSKNNKAFFGNMF